MKHIKPFYLHWKEGPGFNSTSPQLINRIFILSSQPGLITKSFASVELLLVPEKGFNISKLGESSAMESDKLQAKVVYVLKIKMMIATDR